ncbi:MAG: isocitrate lyase/PEP mutase family protein [bacterium]
MKKTTRLRELIDREEILIAPGTYDPLMAKVIEHVGFEAIYMTGAGVSHSTLAMPDLGLVTMTEMVDRARKISDAGDLPVIADADNGYGNAINVMRTVREYERAGVAGIHIEDQTIPKRCGHFSGKTVIPRQEMVGKLKAALDTRQDPDFIIIARTDARTAVSLDEAIERGQAYAEAGADVVFVESPRSVEELTLVAQSIDRPLLANMVEAGLTPLMSGPELQELGFSLVIFPGALTRFLTKQAVGFLTTLKEERTTNSRLDEIFDFKEYNTMLGLEKFEELSRRYGS